MALAIASLSVVGGGYALGYVNGSYKMESAKREYLLDFIHYCQGNE